MTQSGPTGDATPAKVLHLSERPSASCLQPDPDLDELTVALHA
jgi:hypothetical protein